MKDINYYIKRYWFFGLIIIIAGFGTIWLLTTNQAVSKNTPQTNTYKLASVDYHHKTALFGEDHSYTRIVFYDHNGKINEQDVDPDNVSYLVPKKEAKHVKIINGGPSRFGDEIKLIK